jgi:hypothetical protein
VINVPPPSPKSGQGVSHGEGETPDEQESDFIEQLSDICT